MTGKYSKIGKAIYDGIEIELNLISTKDKPEITIYDTGDDEINLKKIYSEILLNNADFVIGPLQKNLINKISRYGVDSLPILTLNYSNKISERLNSIYQFGLLPEDEAICIAEKAIIDGNNNASLLYPDNKWGKRIASSFSLRFEELGGKIIDEIIYEEDDKQINNSVKNLLQIEKSIKRKNKIQNILNVKLQYKPYIINDLDMVFSVGKSKDMRAIKPQFNFNYAEDIPFYSTSHIYSGVKNKEMNEDLNDIKFCDIPWIYNNNNLNEKNKFTKSTNKKDLLRFIALGMDSLKIIRNISDLKLFKNKYLPGNTGYLQLDEFNKVRRNLIIIKFKNGVAKKIPF
jgi:outer membrane PBP1 activator LpoA protein